MPFPSPGDLSEPGIEPKSLALAGRFFTIVPPGKPKIVAAAAAKSLQSCPTLCDPIDGTPPGSPVPGILQARTLEWAVIPFSRGSSSPWDRTQVSHITDRFFEPLKYDSK